MKKNTTNICIDLEHPNRDRGRMREQEQGEKWENFGCQELKGARRESIRGGKCKIREGRKEL